MANSRKRVKRKSNVKSNQQVASRKRVVSKKTSESETNSQSKRRRSNRYNLRNKNSVELVSETPCLQNAEQREKYSKLGLNSALFIKGSQCPKRKQSHISIITISSDDEETSEERTAEWVNHVKQNYQSGVEPAEAQHFHPLCTSTPTTSQITMQCPANHLSSTEASMPCESDSELITSNENQSNHSGPTNDKEEQNETFQLTIAVPESLTDSEYAMEFQEDKLDKTKTSGSIISSAKQEDDQGTSEDSSFITEFQQVELHKAHGYENMTLTDEQGNDQGMYDDDSNCITGFGQDQLDKAYTYGNITSSVEQRHNQDITDDLNYITEVQQNDLGKDEESGYITSNLWSIEKKIKQHDKDTGIKNDNQSSLQSFNLASGFCSTSSCDFFKTFGSKETWPPNQFYFGPSSESKNLVPVFTQEFLFDSHPTVNNNPVGTSASNVIQFPQKNLNDGKEETNEFLILGDSSVQNTNNEKDSDSLNSDDPDGVLESNTFSKST